MLTNEIKKGAMILMTHGRFGKMMDNKKGNIRLVEVTNGVNGPELGSVYVWDIVGVQVEEATFTEVILTEKQKADHQRIKTLGF